MRSLFFVIPLVLVFSCNYQKKARKCVDFVSPVIDNIVIQNYGYHSRLTDITQLKNVLDSLDTLERNVPRFMRFRIRKASYAYINASRVMVHLYKNTSNSNEISFATALQEYLRCKSELQARCRRQ